MIVCAPTLVKAQFTKEEIKVLKKSVKEVGAAGRYDIHNKSFHVVSGAIRLKESSMFLYFDLNKVGGNIVKSGMKIKIEYNASSWLFLDELSIAMGVMKDGDDTIRTSARIPIEKGSRNVNSNAIITEIAVENLNDEMYELLNYLSLNSRLCSVKISGEGAYVDYVVFGHAFVKNFEGIFNAHKNIDFNNLMLSAER